MNPLSTLQAVLVTGALGVAVASGSYIKGRVDGWGRRDEAQKVTDLAALVQRVSDFEAQLLENRQDGLTLDEITRAVRDGTQELPDAIADMFVCPTDPERRRVLNASTELANRALDAATGRKADDASAAAGPAARSQHER